VRRPPKEGWSWIDRRFLRERAEKLERDSILLYFFLAAVSDKDGLSYWGNPGIARHLRMTEEALARAREELERQDLIAYQPPLYQVLSLTTPLPVSMSNAGPTLLGDIFRQIAAGAGSGKKDRGAAP